VVRVSFWPPHGRDPCPDRYGPRSGFVARSVFTRQSRGNHG
jgi:hypothetical protein